MVVVVVEMVVEVVEEVKVVGRDDVAGRNTLFTAMSRVTKPDGSSLDASSRAIALSECRESYGVVGCPVYHFTLSKYSLFMYSHVSPFLCTVHCRIGKTCAHAMSGEGGGSTRGLPYRAVHDGVARVVGRRGDGREVAC